MIWFSSSSRRFQVVVTRTQCIGDVAAKRRGPQHAESPRARSLLMVVAFAVALFVSLDVLAHSRVLVLTGIENEPDDAMSMVRLLAYANQWDIEGLVATTSVHQKSHVAAWRIREIVLADAKVRDNLEKHEHGFPIADQLLSVIRTVPAKIARPGAMHIVLAVTDRGTPALTRYRRVIVDVRA